MKKAILVDGNNLLFRSYYATAYKGSILRNSKGFPTNALYGFINMMNKIIKEEEPNYIMVAFDKGKTFRHDKYKEYKDGRKETPSELKEQFPVAISIAEAMGITCLTCDNYEADDIIGTFAKVATLDDDCIATIISSDKDLLQLISPSVSVKLLKSNDFIMMNEKTFFDTYGIKPEGIVDLKALMGDASDNIPGVKGIGEKTALSLLHKYNTLDGVYENIDSISDKVKEKLVDDKDNAYFSRELATICTEAPVDTDFEKIKYNGITPLYVELLTEYEFFSILKKVDIVYQKEDAIISFKVVDEVNSNMINDDFALYLEVDGNYHDQNIIGMGIYNKDVAYYTTNLKSDIFSKGYKIYTYDLKKLLVLLMYNNISFNEAFEDLMLVCYLLNYNIKNDIAALINDINVKEIDNLLKHNKDEIGLNTVKKAKYIYENYERYYKELNQREVKLYEEMEKPLSYVLADMEKVGVRVDKDVLDKMEKEVLEKMGNLEKKIYDLAGCSFNILSPKQLGKILFEKLRIPYPKKIKDDNYSTSVDILNKLLGYEIVSLVLDYRAYAKLCSNYIVGVKSFVKDDLRVHTTFNQTLTRTGRLSSENPNLQNIPVREEYGKLVRKAFVASSGCTLISSDYSQIELRVFAHMANATHMIEAFKMGLDIHTKSAMDIFHVGKEEVTPKMRRVAKAVNFGIIYGISSFGLSEDLGISFGEAKSFIDNYLTVFPEIKDYMNLLTENALKNGYVETLFGRKRKLEELHSSNYMVRSGQMRMALNTPIQGTAADIIKIAMINIYKRFKLEKVTSKMIIQVHDELIFDVLKEEEDKVEKIIKEEMENAYKLKMPLVVAISSGSNLYLAK